jgi:hypothetical protein
MADTALDPFLPFKEATLSAQSGGCLHPLFIFVS